MNPHATTRLQSIVTILQWILFLPAHVVGWMKQGFIWIAGERGYWLAWIPCSAGLWPLGLYGWNQPVARSIYRIPLRMFSYVCFVAGTFLFFAGLWRFSLIVLVVRLLRWLDSWLQLDKPFISLDAMEDTSAIGRHPFDRLSLGVVGVIFLFFAINKERLVDLTEPSDHFYHMAVAQKILERSTIPLWDDWEFAPMGRPHLYPPLLHLVIAFFAGTPNNMLAGFSTVQLLLYPSALLAYWYLFRNFISPSWAYLSLLILMMEFLFSMGCLIALPASCVNVLWPLILIALFKKRVYLAIVLLGAAFYTHTGMPLLICLGLLIMGIWKRDTFWPVIATILGALVLALPWMVRYYVFSDWMQAGGAQGFNITSIISRLMWLQILNPIFIILMIWGWRRTRNLTLFKTQVLGFLPMLTQYGGRFFMHGAPFLSPFIAVHFNRWLTGPITRRRAFGFLLITLIPLPCISFMNGKDLLHPGFMPGISATHACIFFTIQRQPKDHSDLDELTRIIRETTSPEDIIHLPDEGTYHFGDLIVVLTGRRTDMGGWGEVRKPEMFEAILKQRADDNDGIFVSRYKENIPSARRIQQVGSYYIGYPPNSNDISQRSPSMDDESEY